MTRAERKAATRAALIDAGERLVRKKGFAVSVDEIAAEAGFTKGAVYSNFAGRAELFEQISSRVIPGQQIVPDLTLPTLADALEDAAQQMVEAIDNDSEQLVLQLDGIVQLLRDDELRRAMLSDAVPGSEGHPGPDMPWPLPIDRAQWYVAVNALALGLAAHRLMFGAEAVPDELFRWTYRRLAGD
jgi:AcrR family transcriptional regulator